MSTPERILLVDDDEGVRRVFSRSLRAAGYEVRAVDSAGEVLAAAVEFQPSLILLDAKLPDGDGREILVSIRLNPGLATTRVAFVSGSWFPPDKLDEYTWFLAKPIQLAALVDAVKEILACERRGSNPA